MIEQGNGNGYRPTYKRVKVTAEHCPRCQTMMRGNGSMVTPYRCECGEWRYSYSLSAYEIVTLAGEVLK